MVGAHGDKFDFKGKDGAVYAMLSAKGMEVNGRFTHDVYRLNDKEVHGSFITETYMTVRTSSGEDVRISYNATHPDRAHLHIGERTVTIAVSPFGVNEVAVDQFDHLNLNVLLSKEQMNEATLTVSNGAWRVTCKTHLYPYSAVNKMKKRLDLSFLPGPEQASNPVSPHGIIGQTFDRDEIAIDGAQDTYVGETVTTTAMGEGAIEGVAADYEVSPKDPYSTQFKFTRYDVVAAAPRDILKLTGLKRKAASSSGASAVNDVPSTEMAA